MDFTATDVSNINLVILSNGIFDKLHITKNTSFEDTGVITTDWDYDTIIHALFNGELSGGNVSYTAAEVSTIRVKRRRKNTYNWITLYEIPIATYSDFVFERFDRPAGGGNKEYNMLLFLL